MSNKNIPKKIGAFYKKIKFIDLFAIALIIIWVSNYIINQPTISNKLLNIIQTEEIESRLPEESKEKLLENLIIQKSEKFTLLFSKFDIASIVLEWWIKTNILDWNKIYLTVYEIDWGLDTYIKIKNSIQNTIKSISENKDDSKFEANNLWTYSFYYNNNRKQDTTFLVSLIKWKVWWFEYPQGNHKEMKIFTKSIVDNLQ